jgi:hypothetical protein
MKLRSNYRVQVSKRVHVSRIVITPLAAARAVGRMSGSSAPDPGAHSRILLLVRNSGHIIHQRSLLFLWRGFVSPDSASSLLRTIKLRLVTTCTGNLAQ